MLIPPYETFLVTAIVKKEYNGMCCNVVYKLESTSEKSNLKCIKVKSGSSAVVPSLFVTVLRGDGRGERDGVVG